MDVLLSIKPKYVDAIFRREKEYEFRKIIFKNKSIKNIYMYSTSPIKRIVGSFAMRNIICDSPENLWRKFRDYSGLNDKEFFNYFGKREKGFAIEIGIIKKFEIPIDPKVAIPGFMPPLSFCYLYSNLEIDGEEIIMQQKDLISYKTALDLSDGFSRQEHISRYF
jgi:type I restriction enzyme S subunit